MSTPREDVLEALRTYAVRYQESAHHMSEYLELPMNDGAALQEILWAENGGKPLSATLLRWRIGMTSGATNALIKRLEARNLVTRSRESADGRIVTLRATNDARALAEPYIRPSLNRLEETLASYTDDELSAHAAFLQTFADILPQDRTAPENQRDT